MIAQLSNIQQFFAAHLSDVLDWGKHVRPDPERKTNGDAAYVVIDSGLNRYKLGCLSTYVEPPAGALYQCKALGTVMFDDFTDAGKHIIAPKCDATWAEISNHIHVRELTDGLAIARRELAEASPETVGSVRVRVAELVARAQKWGIEAKGLPALVEVPKADDPRMAPGAISQWTPQELVAMQAKASAPPVFTVADQRATEATTFSSDRSDKPFLGCPIIFITNPGEAITGMTEIPGWVVNVHTDDMISAFVTPDHSEPMYRDKLQRRNPSRNIRSNCWDFNERLMAPFRMAAEVAALTERLDAMEKRHPADNIKLAEMQAEATAAAPEAPEAPAKRGPGRPRKTEAA